MGLTLVLVLLLISGSYGNNKQEKKYPSKQQRSIVSTILSKEAVVSSNIAHGLSGCFWLKKFKKQYKQCVQRRGLAKVLQTARNITIAHCQQQFEFDRWNCSLGPHTFKRVYRETAYVQALFAAALAYTAAKACTKADLQGCLCAENPTRPRGAPALQGHSLAPQKMQQIYAQTAGVYQYNSAVQNKHNGNGVSTFKWGGGCGDNTKQAVKIAWRFLRTKYGNPKKQRNNDKTHIDVLNYDSKLGLDLLDKFETDVCTCHGYSGSCTIRSCWKRLQPFNQIADQLKQLYHKAECATCPNHITNNRITRIFNNNSEKTKQKISRKQLETSSTTNVTLKSHSKDNKLIYLKPSPNYCETTGRRCRDSVNCATLCCGRYFHTSMVAVTVNCNFRMEGCCEMKFDRCQETQAQYTCY